MTRSITRIFGDKIVLDDGTVWRRVLLGDSGVYFLWMTSDPVEVFEVPGGSLFIAPKITNLARNETLHFYRSSLVKRPMQTVAALVGRANQLAAGPIFAEV